MLGTILALVALSGGAIALNNGLARTPPMGWLVWERFRCNTNCAKDPTNCISEQLFMDMADRMAADGYLDAGYEYVNLDDCWSSKQRDAQGRLQADPDRFPHGMKALADYLHGKGLKLGIYADYGNFTCEHYPGSLGYLQTDAQTFADWGIDMLKMDGCSSNVEDMKTGYPQMTMYLNQTGRPILFSCSWPDYERSAKIPIDYQMIADNCNIWRNYDDINSSWNSVLGIIDYYTKERDTLAPFQGPGNFNDPDMILAGDPGISVEQAKAQLALWSMFSAPLLMSNDLRNIDPQLKDILLNKEVIAINQDTLGAFGKLVQQIGIFIDVWTKPLSGGSFAAVVLNIRQDVAYTYNFTIAQLDFLHPAGYKVRDLYLHKDLGTFLPTDNISVTVKTVGVVMMRCDPVLTERKVLMKMGSNDVGGMRELNVRGNDEIKMMHQEHNELPQQ